jgi:lysophospholipase L1-like esterase
LLVAASLVGTLALAEIVVRVLDLGPKVTAVYRENYQLSADSVLRYELRPRSHLGPITINAAGMRDQEYAVEKPPRTFRIATIGDSIGFGYGTHQGGAFGDRLEEFLNEYYGDRGWRFEVLNFCVTGYNITQAVEMLRARALAYDPDLVLYGYCLNDPQDYSFELESLRAELSAAEDGYRQRLAHEGRRLAFHCRLFALARYALDARSHHGAHEVAPEPDWAALRRGGYAAYFRQLHTEREGRERLRTGIADLADLARENGIPAIVAVFPLFRDLSAYPLADVHAIVVGAARAQALQAVDLLPLYRALESTEPGSFAFDDMHPNAIGHAYAALAVLQQMLSHGDLPLPDHDLERVVAPGGAEAHWAATVMAVATNGSPSTSGR